MMVFALLLRPVCRETFTIFDCPYLLLVDPLRAKHVSRDYFIYLNINERSDWIVTLAS